MTELMASDPYNALCGPRTTSTRPTPSVETSPKSKYPPPRLTFTPSIRIRLWSDSPPRVKSDVTPPRLPLWTRVKPGTSRNCSNRSVV